MEAKSERKLVMRTNVLQDWLSECSLKEQTVVLCGLRGGDCGMTPEIKSWTRWIRKHTLRNADPGHKFMGAPTVPISIREIADKNPAALDMLPVHYYSHLMHSLQVLGFCHSDAAIANVAYEAYEDLCNHLHVGIEHYAQMHQRLKDKEIAA